MRVAGCRQETWAVAGALSGGEGDVTRGPEVVLGERCPPPPGGSESPRTQALSWDEKEPLPGRQAQGSCVGAGAEKQPPATLTLPTGRWCPGRVTWSSPTGPRQAFTERRLWAWPRPLSRAR